MTFWDKLRAIAHIDAIISIYKEINEDGQITLPEILVLIRRGVLPLLRSLGLDISEEQLTTALNEAAENKQRILTLESRIKEYKNTISGLEVRDAQLEDIKRILS